MTRAYLTRHGAGPLPEEFLHTVLGDKAKLVVLKHFLQDGYSLALSRKISFFDAARNEVPLPDSTCLVVIEKSRGGSGV